MSVLAIDLGTSAVKAIVWDPATGVVVARALAPIATSRAHPTWAEQDAATWWLAVEEVLKELPFDGINAIGLSSQRETFVCLDDAGRPLRPAVLWSDGRAPTPAARAQWLAEHEPAVWARTRWLAAPKDVVLQSMTGRLVTDTTLASRTDVDATLLPEVVDPRTVVGEYHGIPVVAGAGDRACEVLAVGASPEAPMVSWGTTANISVPSSVDDAPPGWFASRTTDGATLLEAGLSAAGSALHWLSATTGVGTDELTRRAVGVPPGASGVVVLPWFNGARAPWWRADASATFVGVTHATTPAELARAIYEGVAHDIRRALQTAPREPIELRPAGGGAGDRVWREVLAGVTGLDLVDTYGADAAAVGAAWLATDDRPPALTDPARRTAPDAEHVTAYASFAHHHDEIAATVLGIG